MWCNSSYWVLKAKIRYTIKNTICTENSRGTTSKPVLPMFPNIAVSYILNLMLEIHNNKNNFNRNSYFHNYNTRCFSFIWLHRFHLIWHVRIPSIFIYVVFYQVHTHFWALESKFQFNIKRFIMENTFHSVSQYTMVPFNWIHLICLLYPIYCDIFILNLNTHPNVLQLCVYEFSYLLFYSIFLYFWELFIFLLCLTHINCIYTNKMWSRASIYLSSCISDITFHSTSINNSFLRVIQSNYRVFF